MSQESRSLLNAQKLQFIEESLSRGVSHGERSVAKVRIVATSLAMLSVLINDGIDAILGLEVRPWISMVGLASAIGASAWELAALEKSGEGKVASRRILWLSVTLDAVTIALTLLPTVIWTRATYPGQIHMPAFYFFAFAIALAGLRLDRRLVHWAVLLNGTLAAGIAGLDSVLNGPIPLFAPPDLFIGVALFATSTAMGYAIAGRTRQLVLDGARSVLEAERVRQALGIYVSEAIAEQALAGGELRPGGERRPVAVLFSDLRGFTAYADNLQPERLVSEVNDYLDRMVEVIRAEGGVVDKYIGDAIMVVFGIPEARADDALRAIRTASAMQSALTRHNVERAAGGLPPLKQGIGVHFGAAVAGNIGSADRLQYTVMGSVVNVASRLESATKTEGVPILISAALVEALDRSDPRCPPLDRHGVLSLRGTEAPVEVYTLSESR